MKHPSIFGLFGVTKVWLFENIICSVLKIGLILNSCVCGRSLYEQDPEEVRQGQWISCSWSQANKVPAGSLVILDPWLSNDKP